MLFWKQYAEPSVHQAVIDNAVDQLASLAEDSACKKERNKLGFTPLELAQLLGRKHCQTLLDPNARKREIKILQKGAKEPVFLTTEQFEKLFEMMYRDTLFFRSYDELKQVIYQCPYLLRSPRIIEECHTLGERYSEEIGQGALAPALVQWIGEPFGYGLIADKDLEEGTLIGEYTGCVRQLSRRNPDHNAYCFQYPTKFWGLCPFAVDALYNGNLLRFLNHSDTPNLQPAYAYDKGLLHLLFFTREPTSKGAELTFDYGADYWLHRHKQ